MFTLKTRIILRSIGAIIGAAAVLGSVSACGTPATNGPAIVSVVPVAASDSLPAPIVTAPAVTEQSKEMAACAQGAAQIGGTCAWDATASEAILTPAKPVPTSAPEKVTVSHAAKHADVSAKDEPTGTPITVATNDAPVGAPVTPAAPVEGKMGDTGSDKPITPVLQIN